MKKILCAALCAAMLMMSACAPARTPAEPSAAPDGAPTETAQPTDAPQEGGDPADAPNEDTFFTKDDAEYRDLYANNAIEAAFDQDFTNAVSVEDFDSLAARYVEAWKSEYHALMNELVAAHPEDAEELKGLIEYTDGEAQAAYDATYAANLYTDESGAQQPSAGAVQNANFDMAEVYKNATVLSILNDYRGETPYVFHYSAQ